MSQNFTHKKDTLKNEQIRSYQIRVIKDGVQLGVMSKNEALNLAREAGLDLIELSKQDKISICILADYGKYKFEQGKKEKLKRKSQVVVEEKELLFSPTIGKHDLDVTIAKLRTFLAEGHPVKLTVRMKSKQIFVPHRDKWHEVLNYVIESVADISSVTSKPVSGNRNLIAKVSPSKNESR